MSVSPLYVLLGEVSVQFLCPPFNWIDCLPGVELCEFLIYFEVQTLVQSIIGKYISCTIGSLLILLMFSLAV